MAAQSTASRRSATDAARPSGDVDAQLYAPSGLAAVRGALRRGGVFAVWSGYPADAFIGALRRAGFRPSVIPLEERGRMRARAYVGRSPS